MNLKWRISLFIIFAVTLAADILTKLAIKANLEYLQSITVIDGFFYIVHVLNPGAAFGFLRNMDDAYRQMFFVIVTSAAIIGIFILMVREKRKFPSVAYLLVISGACGNLIDRIHTG
ncbi:MAG: signal peptidase II, partial [Deferribacterales bacterium]|nr:signal peptidase II [Deferribacterales bacterium]